MSNDSRQESYNGLLLSYNFSSKKARGVINSLPASTKGRNGFPCYTTHQHMDPIQSVPTSKKKVVLLAIILVLILVGGWWFVTTKKPTYKILQTETAPAGATTVGLPAGVIIPNDAVVTKSEHFVTDSKSGQADVWTVTYTTAISVRGLFAQYNSFFKKNGWSIVPSTSSTTGETGTQLANNGNGTLSIFMKTLAASSTEVMVNFRKPISIQ